jgi:hypothetical protein
MTDESTNMGTDGDNPPPAPAVDLSPLEQRLSRITDAVTSLTRRDREREVQSAAERLKAYEAQIASAVRNAEANVDAAEKALARAHEDGDAVAIARATRQVTDAVAEREGVRLEKRDFDRARAENERRRGGSTGARGDGKDTQPEGQRDTTNLNDWKSRNAEWYGVDAGMTKAAHEIDRSIRQAGVIAVGSPDYFKAIDRQMAQRYPEKFRSAPNNSGSGSGAPAGGQRPNGGRIPKEVLDTWAKMGINVNDDKTLERMVKNRATLAEKGILPETPAYGRVI